MSEPTLDFRQKYIAIGREQGRSQAKDEILAELEELSAEPDLELALQQRIIALKASSSPSTKGPSAARAPAGNPDLGDRICDAMGLPSAGAGAAPAAPGRRPATARATHGDLGDRMADAMGLPPAEAH